MSLGETHQILVDGLLDLEDIMPPRLHMLLDESVVVY